MKTKILLFLSVFIFTFNGIAHASDFVIEDGVLIKYTGPGGHVVIPDGVTVIGVGVFANKNISTVIIPEGVTDILSSAFSGNYDLTSVEFPNSLKNIGSYAFLCSFIREENPVSIVLPEGLESIGEYAFSVCFGLVSITIPSTVTSIGMAAFHLGYESFLELIFKWTDPIPRDPSFVFFEGEKVKVPEGTKEKYIAAGWGTSENITEYQSSSVTAINRLQDVVVYPNPAVDYMVVSGVQGCRLTIIDPQGYVIYGKELIKDTETLNTSNWATGIYFVVIQSDNTKIVKSIIKK